MQSTDTVLMIEPVCFGYNEQTASNNYFQQKQEDSNIQTLAKAEFENMVQQLQKKEINVLVIKDTESPHTPDSIFPNNWVSFHDDGSVCLYPMFAPNRRQERRSDILEQIQQKGFPIQQIKDYSQHEEQNIFLEGTGSMILDRKNKLAYGAISLRLDQGLFQTWCEQNGYQAICFESFQSVENQRKPIYHTNVMMCLGTNFAVICLASIDKVEQRNLVVDNLKKTGKEIVEISEEQMHHFAGNMLELQNKQGQRFLVMSKSAFSSLTQQQITTIEKYVEIINCPLTTIETNGGGSARCMLAEVFLPKA